MEKIFLYVVVSALLLFCCIFGFSSGHLFLGNKKVAGADLAGSVATPSPAQRVVVATETVKTFNILVIPGHEPKAGGGSYKNIYERDLAVDIANKIFETLSKDSEYKVTVARDENDWNPILKEYFQTQKQAIINFKTKCQQDTKALMASGKMKYVPNMGFHADASQEMSVRLYGMNKWANENDIDLVLNLHFNDEQRPNINTPGDLSGFVIFVPESQMKNSQASKLAAQDIFDQLKSVESPQVNYLLEDQSLIALGASGTMDAPSLLIEYAYIFEKKLRTDTDRLKTLDEFAQQTVLGIKKYVTGIAKTSN